MNVSGPVKGGVATVWGARGAGRAGVARGRAAVCGDRVVVRHGVHLHLQFSCKTFEYSSVLNCCNPSWVQWSESASLSISSTCLMEPHSSGARLWNRFEFETKFSWREEQVGSSWWPYYYTPSLWHHKDAKGKHLKQSEAWEWFGHTWKQPCSLTCTGGGVSWGSHVTGRRHPGNATAWPLLHLHLPAGNTQAFESETQSLSSVANT